ncbi:MAG: ABC transporter ATP-binding protein [Synergistaceae bacterium]|jgi:branched-chain amino acid transport system ATP-binding protein|nr:ABC transporter ATP-binding protein [Synergistaceae bacterium]
MLLEITNLCVVVDGLRVLEGIDITIDEGRLVAVVGANGAGKSTLLRAISGLDKPWAGKIEFEGLDITGWQPKAVAALGIAMVPEGKKLFYEMTVLENLKMGAYRFKQDAPRIARNIDRVFQLFPVLGENRNRIAGTFSGGEQQMLTIARGLMSDPKLLMIDELSLGLAPIVVDTLMQTVKELNRDGVSILLVEQNVNQALKIVDYGYVIENGELALEGSGTELRNNEHVKAAYLGL